MERDNLQVKGKLEPREQKSIHFLGNTTSLSPTPFSSLIPGKIHMAVVGALKIQ